MAALLTVTVDDPQDIIDTYGTGARVYVNRGTTDDVDDSSFLTSVLIVAGTTAYEVSDSAGTPGTDRYFIRFGTATPAVADDYGAWSDAILAGDAGGQVLTLETAKRWANIDDSVDDGWLVLAIGAINRAFIRQVGVDIGPSPDTTRTYDACKAVREGRRLWVPGGLRTFTTVEVSVDASTWTAVTSDVRIGPLEHERPHGSPGHYIEFKPYTSGSVSSFAGYAYVRITGPAFETFGAIAYPADAVQSCVAALQRLSADRSGRGAFPTETDAARYLNPATVAYYRGLYFPLVR